MLMDVKTSCLMVVDIQEKLTPLVIEHEILVENAHWLMTLSREMDVPVMVTEQYPNGLGETVPRLRSLSAPDEIFTKVHFGIPADETCLAHLKASGLRQCILCGIETSVCILQSAMQLKEEGFDVFVVADAVSGRHERDSMIALNRMREAGISIVTKEMVFFEWLHVAGTAKFKALSKTLIKR